ncbi:hypothetical protein [Dyadobacter soli]|nr:hypothetical protein [Dyadobacter soli]
MAEYQAKSNSSLTFDLTKGNESIAKLSYKSWFKFSALAEIGNNSGYQIEPKGFWGTTVEVTEGDKVLLQFSMNWNGEIVIQTHFNYVDKGYIFKHKGLFKESFLMVDQEGTELLVMKPHLKWSLMSYEYQIATADSFESLPKKTSC